MGASKETMTVAKEVKNLIYINDLANDKITQISAGSRCQLSLRKPQFHD